MRPLGKEAFARFILRRADKDKDGEVTKQELDAHKDALKPRRKRMHKVADLLVENFDAIASQGGDENSISYKGKDSDLHQYVLAQRKDGGKANDKGEGKDNAKLGSFRVFDIARRRADKNNDGVVTRTEAEQYRDFFRTADLENTPLNRKLEKAADKLVSHFDDIASQDGNDNSISRRDLVKLRRQGKLTTPAAKKPDSKEPDNDPDPDTDTGTDNNTSSSSSDIKDLLKKLLKIMLLFSLFRNFRF